MTESRDTLAAHYRRLTGQEAARRLLAEAEREEFVSLWLLARALGCSNKRVRRDWESRGHRITRVGHEDKVVARHAVSEYFPHADMALPPDSPA